MEKAEPILHDFWIPSQTLVNIIALLPPSENMFFSRSEYTVYIWCGIACLSKPQNVKTKVNGYNPSSCGYKSMQGWTTQTTALHLQRGSKSSNHHLMLVESSVLLVDDFPEGWVVSSHPKTIVTSIVVETSQIWLNIEYMLDTNNQQVGLIPPLRPCELAQKYPKVGFKFEFPFILSIPQRSPRYIPMNTNSVCATFVYQTWKSSILGRYLGKLKSPSPLTIIS